MKGSWTSGVGGSDVTEGSPGSVHSELCDWSVFETEVMEWLSYWEG